MSEEVHPIVRNSTPIQQFDDLSEVAVVAVFPDGQRMATNSSDGMVRVWDLKSTAMLMELEGRGSAMRELVLSRDGKLIASSDVHGYVVAWHGDTGKLLTQPFIPDSSINGMCALDISPDGTTLATGSYCNMIKLWSTETWQLQKSPRRHSGYVDCVRYSPSGDLLAVATGSTINILKLATQQVIVNLQSGVLSGSLVWMPDGSRLLSGDRDNATVREWESSTWTQVRHVWSDNTAHPWRLAMNCSGTVIASPAVNNCVRLWRLVDGRTVAIFRHSGFPCSMAFTMDGKHILTGGKDEKILEWEVPKHAWPEDARDRDTKAQGSDTEGQDFKSEVLNMSTTVRNACRSGDLTTAEELLTQEIDANGDDYCSYANRSVVMAKKLDWDHALNDATRSLSIQPSLMGYVSKGIALCGKQQVRDAKRAFDLASIFSDGHPKTNHYLFLIKSISLCRANQHAESMRRIRELASVCPDADTTLASRITEVYLHIQLGNSALDRASPNEAADHFTTAVNTGTFLSKLVIDSKYDDFMVLFGCDFNSLWQTANQKRCHALLRAGRLAEVFDAYRYMADMSDESTRASCFNWSITFIQELSTFRASDNADVTPDLGKRDDENGSISDIDVIC